MEKRFEMLTIAVNNIKRKEELDFKAKVLETMKKQIRKKILGQAEGTTIKPNCDAPFIVHNNIQQIKETV